MAPTRAKLFEVSPVPRGERPLPTRPLQACFGELLACDAPHQQVLCHPPGQSLLMAAHIAFQHHFPLVLSPAVL